MTQKLAPGGVGGILIQSKMVGVTSLHCVRIVFVYSIIDCQASKEYWLYLGIVIFMAHYRPHIL